jgi:hypothetical protein
MAFMEGLERGEHRPTYLDVWSGTTVALPGWQQVVTNTLGGGKPDFRK